VLLSTTAILPAPGVYPGHGVFSQAEVQQLRAIGRSAGALLKQQDRPINVELIVGDGLLAALIVRYEVWFASPHLIKDIIWIWPTGEEDLVQRAIAAKSRGSPALVLKAYDSVHCGLYITPTEITLAGSAYEFPMCLSLLERTKQAEAD
jgi:hypothetical protein